MVVANVEVWTFLNVFSSLPAGVPVVACNDGGGVVSALRRHGGGLITDPEPGALAKSAIEAGTARLRDQARVAGQRWRDELAPARVAERFEAWYGEALAR